MKRLLLGLPLLGLLASCGNEDAPDGPNVPGTPESGNVERVVMVYAVNKSSLKSDFEDDSREMLAAMSAIDTNKYRLLVFRTDSNESCGLYTVAMENGSAVFSLVKEFPRTVTSTDPTRISEVLNYALSLYPEADYDLFFWGHGMSWTPYFSSHEAQDGVKRAYGGEYNSAGYATDWTDLDELAEAVPDGKFGTIWFDCCYMSGIETIYQFRDKCNTFVGYPTEVWQYGLNYTTVLPYLLADRQDVTGAARQFFNEYNDKGEPVTVAVIDMEQLEGVADATKAILRSGDMRPQSRELLNYSRSASNPYYDFKEMVTLTAELNGADYLVPVFEKALSEMVIYEAAGDKDFNLRTWNVDRISGISAHLYTGGDTPGETYYRTLDWYARVY